MLRRALRSERPKQRHRPPSEILVLGWELRKEGLDCQESCRVAKASPSLQSKSRGQSKSGDLSLRSKESKLHSCQKGNVLQTRLRALARQLSRLEKAKVSQWNGRSI